MKQITIISGKGGTGKTTITASLACLAKNYVVADCDVDAADLHLLLDPQVKQRYDFYSGKGYTIDLEKCVQCGMCRDLCRYNAINNLYEIDPIACDACGACFNVCPAQAVVEKENCAGEYYISNTKYNMPMIHANLYIAEDNSGKLVAQVRKEARKKATEVNADYILIDGPPGIGCPVNAAIVGVDLALIVTEPTLSGIHDLLRVIELAKHFKIKSKVVINKYDINLENTKRIESICSEHGSDCISKIPYDDVIVKSLIAGKTIADYDPSHSICAEIEKIWEGIL